MCEICRQFPCHPRYPNYSPPQPRIICCYCDEGIYQGEHYLDNKQGEYIHEDCIGCAGYDWLINLLGFEHEEMEE